MRRDRPSTARQPAPRPRAWLVAALFLAGALAGCGGKGPEETYVEMTTAAMMGDVDLFLDGFTKDSKKLVEAQIVLSEAYGMNDLNPYRLLVFDDIAESKVYEKGKTPGTKYKCPEECAVLNVATGRKKRKILMLKTEDGWRIDARELEEFWSKERKRW